MIQPVVVSTWDFSMGANIEASRCLVDGMSSLDAVEKGIRVCEDDPAADTVGYGGIPNSDGIVELDAAIMYGPDRRIGSVAGMRNIAEAISAARLVMERTPHILIVGDEARRFAVENGLVERNLLTDEAKEKWLKWKAEGSGPEGHDTIGMVALDVHGNLCAGTSTSGIKFKQPGRIGDSPLVGCGLYADNDVGAAVATGHGEHIIPYCMTFRIVEEMRSGASPEKACISAIEWALSDREGRETGMIGVIALAKDGRWSCYSTKPGFSVYASVGTNLQRIEADHSLQCGA